MEPWQLKSSLTAAPQIQHVDYNMCMCPAELPAGLSHSKAAAVIWKSSLLSEPASALVPDVLLDVNEDLHPPQARTVFPRM